MLDDKAYVAERGLITEQLLSLSDENSCLTASEREFLLNYFQFERDITRAHYLLPKSIESKELVLAESSFLDAASSHKLNEIFEAGIIGMMYFYGSFKTDMTLSESDTESEQLSVYLFFGKNPDNSWLESRQHNLHHINLAQPSPSLALMAIYERYIKIGD